MRFVTLDLIAYGHFADKTLAFQKEKGLFFVYGDNEAGKSTCLRALKSFLFGIPERSPDGFLHGKNKLRVGASLLLSDGAELSFVRRKGRKDTLLDTSGRAVSEDVLRRCLGGIDEEAFARLFGMDHRELVEGGKAILEGKGALGEALFSAAMGGGVDLKRILSELESEAADLFKPGGSVPRLNALARTYREKRDQARSIFLSATAWRDVDEEVTRLESQARPLREKISEMSLRKDRLTRLRDALPAIAELTEKKSRVAGLGPVKVLRKEFARDRVDVAAALARARADEETTLHAISEIDNELAALTVPEALLAQEATIQTFVEELGSVAKAQKDLLRVQGQVISSHRDAEAILSELRPDLSVERAGLLRLTVERREAIRDLAGKHRELIERSRSADTNMSIAKAKLDAAECDLAGLPAERDVSGLDSAVEAVRRKGELEKTASAALQTARSARLEAERLIATLGLWSGTLEEVAVLHVPQDETLAEFIRLFDDHEKSHEKVKEAIAKEREAMDNLEWRLKEFDLSGPVPTVEDLKAVRNHRDIGWRLVRKAWIEGKRDEEQERDFDSVLSLDAAYESSVGCADDMADQMRREADRVAERERLLLEKSRVTARIIELEGQDAYLSAEGKILVSRWQETWASCGVMPQSPREMVGWRIRQQELVRRSAEVNRLDNEALRLSEEVRLAIAHLTEWLDPLLEPRSLEEILSVAEGIVKAEKDRKARREALSAAIEAARLDQERARSDREKLEIDLSIWNTEWSKAVGDLSPTLTVPASASFLDRCNDLNNKIAEANGYQDRIDKMRKEIAIFREKAEKFVMGTDPKLSPLPMEQAVREISARAIKGKADLAEKKQLRKKLSERKAELEKTRRTIREMEGRLSILREEADAGNDDDLPLLEARSEEVRAIDERVETLTTQILALSGGKPVEEFASEARGSDPEEVRSELARIEEELDQAQEEFGRVSLELGAAKERLKNMDGRDAASQLNQEAQETLSLIREEVERFVKLRLAARVLKDEIERYRESSQGALLKRAGEYFSLVTKGSFAGFLSDYDEEDNPILIGVRGSGEKVSVPDMSDGAQDQLYLALRLASLERSLEGGEPIPFIVDDALVNFDNPRAAAAVSALSELAKKTQVLVFTHHRHLIGLAEKEADASILGILEL
jgi:uncharacterized protein YhaN